LTEFIGTFFLVLVVALVVSANPISPVAGLAVGLTLAALVYMGGHISGAHYNPAVSLAVLLRGKLAPAEMGAYWGVQLVAGILAACVGAYLSGATVAQIGGMAMPQALVAEILFTFALALVVLNVAVSAGTQGNPYFGLAIGLTLAGAAVAVGGISGSILNPAVGIGLAVANILMGGGTFGNSWIYVVGPLVGGALAAGVFGMQEKAHEREGGAA
jgi:aquaporin Z